MLNHGLTRRNLLETMSLVGLGALFPPSIAHASLEEDFNRNYEFQGQLNLSWLIFSTSLNIYGNLIFSGDGDNYNTKLSCFDSEGTDSYYKMESDCRFQNGILIPIRTETDLQIKRSIGGFAVDMFRKDVLTYAPEKITFVSTRGSDGEIKIKAPKFKPYTPLSLDYISSVLRLMLEARDGNVSEEIDLINGSGNTKPQRISFDIIEETVENPGGYRISAIYEDPSKESGNGCRFFGKNKDTRIQNCEQRKESSIALELDSDKELTRIVLAHDYGNIDANVE